jgi:hypothetical protein
MFILNVVLPVKSYQNRKFCGPTLIGASFASISEVLNIHHFRMAEATG